MAKARKILKEMGVEFPEHFYKKWVGDPFTPVKTRMCDHPSCGQVGEHKAPQSRERLNSYYWFCLEHVKEYNAAWDYYAGMERLEMERAIRFGALWERPTWPMGLRGKNIWQAREEKLKRAFSESFVDNAPDLGAGEPKAKFDMAHIDPRYRAQLEALHELGLDPPVDFEAIKKRYRLLVKRHHPDAAQNKNKSAEQNDERIKKLNSAFTVLRAFYAVEE